MDNNKLLLTGFEPFGSHETNPSWQIAQALDGEQSGTLRVVSRKLPVHWEQSWPALRDAIGETGAGRVLMLGLAGKRTAVGVERRACNSCDPKPDNSGALPQSAGVEEGGEQFLSCTLPVEAMSAAIRECGVPVELSDDAGGYLCNHTLYRALAWDAGRGGGDIQVGFIHVPPVGGQEGDNPALSLDRMAEAIRACIKVLAEA